MQDGYKFSSIPNVSPIDVFRELRSKNLVQENPFVQNKPLNPYAQNWVNNYEIIKKSTDPEIMQALQKKQQELIDKGIIKKDESDLNSIRDIIFQGMLDSAEIPTFKSFIEYDVAKIESEIAKRKEGIKSNNDKINVPAHLVPEYEKSLKEFYKDWEKATPEQQKDKEAVFKSYWKQKSYEEIHGKNSHYSKLLDEDYGRNNLSVDSYGKQKLARSPINPEYLHNNLNDTLFSNKKTKLWYEIESFIDTYNKAFGKNVQLSEDFDENIELYKSLYPEYKKIRDTPEGKKFELLMGEKYFQDGLAQKKQSETVRESPEVLERIAKFPLGGFAGQIVHEFMDLEDIGKSLYKGAQNTILFNWLANVLVDKYDAKDLPNEYFLSKIDPKAIADRIKDDSKLMKELGESPDIGFGSRLFFKKMAEVAVENIPTMAEFILMNKAMGLAGKMTANWSGGIRGMIGKSLSSARYLEEALPMSEFMLKNGAGAWKYIAEVGKRAGAGFIVGAQTLGTTNLYRNLYNNKIFEANDNGTINRNQAVADIIYNIVSGGMENLSENIFFMPYLKGGKVLNGFAKQLEKNIFASVMSEVLEEEITNITDDYYQQFVKDKYQTTALVTKPFRENPQWENTYIQLGTALSTLMLAQTMGKFSTRQENAFYAKFGEEIKPLLQKYLTKETLESKLQDMVTKFEQYVPVESQIAFKQANQSNQFMYGAYQQGKNIIDDVESIQKLSGEEFDNAKIAFESKYEIPLDEVFTKLNDVKDESSFIKRLYLGTNSFLPSNVQDYLSDIKNLHSLQESFNKSIADQELGLKDLIEENLDKILENNPDKDKIKQEFVQRYFFDNVMDSPSAWLGELTTDSKTNVRLFALAKQLNEINANKAKTENEREIEISKQFLENIKIEEKKVNKEKRDTSSLKKQSRQRVEEIDNEISILQSQIDSSTGKSKKGIKEAKDKIDNLLSEKYELESEINENLTIDEKIAKLQNDKIADVRTDQATMDNYETEINNLKEEKKRNQNKKKDIAEAKKNLEQRIVDLEEENAMLDNLEAYYEKKDNVKDQIKASRLLTYHFKDIESTILEDYSTLKEALRTLTGVKLSNKEFWRAKWNSGARNGREAYLFLKKALEKYAQKEEVDFKDIELFNTIRQVVEKIDRERALRFGLEEEKNDKYETIITEKWRSYFKGDIDAIDRMIQSNLREAFNYHNYKAGLSFNPVLYKEVLDMISKEDFEDWGLLEKYLFELGPSELAEISFRLKALNSIKYEKEERVEETSIPITEDESLPTGVEDKEEKSTGLSYQTNILDKETGRPLVFIQYQANFVKEFEVKTEKGWERLKGQLAIPLRSILYNDLQRKQVREIIYKLFEESGLPQTENYKKFVDLFVESVLNQELIDKSKMPKNLISDEEKSSEFANVLRYIRTVNEVLNKIFYSKMGLEDIVATTVIKGKQYDLKEPQVLTSSTHKPFVSNPTTFYLYYKDLFDSTKTLGANIYAPNDLTPIFKKMEDFVKNITQKEVTVTSSKPSNSLVEPQTPQKGSEVSPQENKPVEEVGIDISKLERINTTNDGMLNVDKNGDGWINPDLNKHMEINWSGLALTLQNYFDYTITGNAGSGKFIGYKYTKLAKMENNKVASKGQVEIIFEDYKSKINETTPQNASNNAQEASQDTKFEETTKSMPTEEIVPPAPFTKKVDIAEDEESITNIEEDEGEIENLEVDGFIANIKQNPLIEPRVKSYFENVLTRYKNGYDQIQNEELKNPTREELKSFRVILTKIEDSRVMQNGIWMFHDLIATYFRMIVDSGYIFFNYKSLPLLIDVPIKSEDLNLVKSYSYGEVYFPDTINDWGKKIPELPKYIADSLNKQTGKNKGNGQKDGFYDFFEHTDYSADAIVNYGRFNKYTPLLSLEGKRLIGAIRIANNNYLDDQWTQLYRDKVYTYFAEFLSNPNNHEDRLKFLDLEVNSADYNPTMQYFIEFAKIIIRNNDLQLPIKKVEEFLKLTDVTVIALDSSLDPKKMYEYLKKFEKNNFRQNGIFMQNTNTMLIIDKNKSFVHELVHSVSLNRIQKDYTPQLQATLDDIKNIISGTAFGFLLGDSNTVEEEIIAYAFTNEKFALMLQKQKSTHQYTKYPDNLFKQLLNDIFDWIIQKVTNKDIFEEENLLEQLKNEWVENLTNKINPVENTNEQIAVNVDQVIEDFLNENPDLANYLTAENPKELFEQFTQLLKNNGMYDDWHDRFEFSSLIEYSDLTRVVDSTVLSKDKVDEINNFVVPYAEEYAFDPALQGKYTDELTIDYLKMAQIFDKFKILFDIEFDETDYHNWFRKIGLSGFLKATAKPSDKLKQIDPELYRQKLEFYEIFDKMIEDGINEHKVLGNPPKWKLKALMKRAFYQRYASSSYHRIYEFKVTEKTVKGEEEEQEVDIRYSAPQINNIEKTKTAGGEYITSDRPNLKIDGEFKDPIVTLINDSLSTILMGENMLTGIETEYIVSFFGEHLGESKNKSLKEHIAQDLKYGDEKNNQKKIQEQNKIDMSSEALGAIRQTYYQAGGLIFLNKFGEKNHYPCYRLKFNEEIKAQVKEKFNLSHNDIFFEYFIFPLYKFYRAEGIKYLVNKNYVQAGLLNDEEVQKFQKENQIEDFGKAKEMLYQEYSKIESRNFLSDEDFEGVETKGMLYNSKTKQEELTTYKKYGNNRPVATSLVLRILAEEFKLMNDPKKNFHFYTENGERKVDINSMLFNRNMIELMKRATPVLEQMPIAYTVDDLVIPEISNYLTRSVDRVNLEQKGKGSSIFLWQDDKLYFKTVFMDTKKIPDELKPYFYNKYGQFRFDGASFVLRGVFDTAYAKLVGAFNESTAKNVILWKNLFIKHAVHAVAENDPLGKWMMENRVGMLVFDEGEKNKVLLNHINGETNESLLYDSKGRPIPYSEQKIGFLKNNITTLNDPKMMKEMVSYYIPFEAISRIGEKYSNTKTVKALQQFINSSGLSERNKIIKNTKILNHFAKYAKTFADEINAKVLPDGEGKETHIKRGILTYLKRIMESPTKGLQSELTVVFPQLLQMMKEMDSEGNPVFTIDEQFEYLKILMNFDMVNDLVQNFMNDYVQNSVAYQDRGRQLTLCPDLGSYLGQARLDYAIKQIQEEFSEEKSAKFIKEAFDENGFLNRDYVFISEEIAKDFGLKVGDKFITTIIPSAGLMEGKGVIIAGILPINKISPNSIIMNSEYVQGIGRDYDIDVLNAIFYNNERWKDIGGEQAYSELVDTLMDIEKDYAEAVYDEFEKTGVNFEKAENEINGFYQNTMEEDKNYLDSLSSLDRKMAIAFNNDVMTDYQMKFLGATNTIKKFYSPAEYTNTALADVYRKDVGFVIVLRALHQFLSKKGMKFDYTVKEADIKDEKGKVIKEGTVHNFKCDLTDKSWWFKVHISLMIATQHQVDYPKNISKDFYDGSAPSFFAKMIGLTIPFNTLSREDQKAITELYEAVRQKIIPALRIPKYVQKKGETLASDKSKFNALIDKATKFQILDSDNKKITKTFERTSFYKNNIKNSQVTFDESPAPQPYHEFANTLNLDAMSRVNEFIKRTVRNNHVITKNVESMIHLDLISRQQPNLIAPKDVSTFRSNLGAMFKVAYKLTGNGELVEIDKVTLELDNRGCYQTKDIPLLPNHYVKPDNTVENFTGFALQNNYQVLSGYRFNVDPRTAPEPEAPLWNFFIKSVRRGYHSLMQETVKNLKLTGAIDKNPAQQRFELALFYGLPLKLGLEMFKQKLIALPNAKSANQSAYRLISSVDPKNKRKSLIQKYTALYNKGKENKDLRMPYQLMDTEEFFKFVLESTEFNDFIESNYKQYSEHYENPQLANVTSFYHTLYGVDEKLYLNNNTMILQAPQIQYYLMDSGLLPPMDIFNSEFVFGLYNQLKSDQALNSKAEGMEDLYKSLSIVLFTTAFVSGRREYVEQKAVDESNNKIGTVKNKFVKAYGLKELQDKTKQTLVYSELISEQVYSLFKRKNIVLEKDLIGKDSLLYTDSDGNQYTLSVKSVFTHNEQNELQSDTTFIIQKNNETPVIKEGTLVKSDLFSEILTQPDFFNDEENRMKIAKAINLTNEVNFGLTDRIESATKVLPKVMSALGLYDQVGKKPTEKGQEILDMALTWLMGYSESIAKTDMPSNLMTMNLYIPGVLIDNRVLWSIIARWSPTLHKEYMTQFAEILLDSNLSDRLNEVTETQTDLKQLTAYERKVKANRQAYRRFKTKISVRDGLNNEEAEVGDENGLEDMVETANEYSSYWMFDMNGIEKLSYDPKNDNLIEESFKKVIKVAEDLNQTKYDVVIKGREKSLIQYLSNENVTPEQALNWLQNNYKFSSVFKNRQGVIKGIKDTRTQFRMINMMYVDLQRIKRSIANPKEIKGNWFGLRGNASDRKAYLMSMARSYEVLNFNIFDNPLDLDKIIVTRTFNLDRVELPESAILQPAEKVKKADSPEVKAQKEAIAEQKKKNRASYFNSYYTIDMNVSNILSKGVYPYNPEYSSLRPYGLFSLSYAKYQKTNQDIKVELKKVQEIISRLANMEPVSKRETEGTKKILAGSKSLKSGGRYKIMQFQSTAYAIADRLGYDPNFNVQFINSNSIDGGKIRIRYGEKTYEQKNVDDFTFLDDLIKDPSFIFRETDGKSIFTPEESYAVLFTAIELRRLFDVQLKNYIQRINYFMSQVSDDFLNNSLFYSQVAELRTKYFRLLQAFSGVRKTKAGEEEITDRKVTPKVYLSSKVKEIYVEQKFSVRYEYYLNKIAKGKFSSEQERKELTALEGKSLKEKEMYVKGKLLEEITHKVGNDMFYVPLFNNEADDSLTDYIAQFQPLQNHVFERLFEQIESDINTIYFYQAKTFAIMNNLPKSHILFLEGWFSGISKSMGLKQLRVPLTQIKEGQFIQFMTEDEGDYTTHYGEFVKFKNGNLDVKIGDTVHSFSKVKVSDYDSLQPKYYDNEVYIATENWQEKVERKASEGNLAYKALYHGFDYAFTKSFVALQMLGVRFLRSKIFNKFGATKQINEFTRSSYAKRTTESIIKRTAYMNVEFEKALRYQLNAISAIGTTMIDSNISVTSDDIVSFSTKNSLWEDMLYFRMLMKKSPEYKEYLDFKAKKEEEIKKLQSDILNLKSNDEDRKKKSLGIKADIRAIRFQIEAARGMIDIDMFKEMFSGKPQDIAKLKKEVGDIATKFQSRENIQELYGLDKNTLIKMIALYGLRRMFTLGFTQVQSVESEMRALGAMRFLDDAYAYGVTEEKDLLAWMQRGSELTNVLYNQGARRANSSGFVSRFLYLLGHYTHTVILHLKQALDELGLQRVNWQLRSLWNISLDTIILDAEDAVKQGRKGSKIVGANALAKLFKLLWINTTVSNIAYTVSGLNFMVHPALAPIFMFIQLAFKAGDDDESLYLSDILFLLNNIMSFRYGMGASFTVNALFNNYTDYVTDKWSIGRTTLSLLHNPANVRSINKIITSNTTDIADLPNQIIDKEAELTYLNNGVKVVTGLGYGRYPFDKGIKKFEGKDEVLPFLGTIAGTFCIPFFPEFKEYFTDSYIEKIKGMKYENAIKKSGVRKANYFLKEQDRIKIK